ncbi:MAG: AMP-binding protein, partial [Oscillospiraceae bacterium]|nr:AMP-binding protein [Oscillospiraceae bacterium]
MRRINERYCEETFDENGVLKTFKLKYPENYNFAYDIVDDIGTNEPDRKAMVWCDTKGNERVFTFGDIMRLSNKCANYLASLGIGRGDRVLVVLRRRYQFWYVTPALMKLGAVFVPATHMLKRHDCVYRIQSGGIKAVICTVEGDTADAFDEALPECPELGMMISSG